MKFKSLALISTSFAALVAFASTAQAAPVQGVIYLGLAEWWDHYDYNSSDQFDYNHPSLYGFGKVNIPYGGTSANLQLDFFGDGSLHESSSSQSVGSLGNVGVGVHINSRDTSEGLLGIFAATGRVWDVDGRNNSPAFMAGLEGQYYCGPWTLYGQAGYMDSNPYFLQNAGFVRGLVSYYATSKLKVTGGLAYIDGETTGHNATAFAWQADAQYWFGKSVPVAFTLKYEGRDAEVHYSSTYKPDLFSNQVSVGFSIYFGAGGIEESDKTGPATEIPNFDWFRIPYD